ncbi:YwiC-like family protein [Corynebacterium pseudotuberculosis]|uniref:YwiC-like family protein n=1 Tax=Corynebacterium pseudotuberculosis TaxID=1719 RepID=UPI002B469B51|nr:YwiC-like family protein [Corynebacterium pseudotuberculosis]MEB3106538.1 YwiC-like family protein [Corynebacterium pseudotuberculosis]
MTRVSTPRKSRRSLGWIPNQHGAWFMVTVPAIIGVALAPAWIDIPLLLLWWCGYFAFFAASVWMRGRYRKHHLPPLVTYGVVTGISGLVVLLCQWQLVVWIPAFLPLIGIAVYETWRRRPRSLLSGLATVCAACLILPVITWAGDGLTVRVWAICGVLLLYFAGSIPYVKTLIRERGSRPWLIGSITFHIVFLIIACVAAAYQMVHVAVAVVAGILLLRAWLMPVTGARRERLWTPRQVGLLDALLGVLVVLTAVLPPA